jgi:hypothetical protein
MSRTDRMQKRRVDDRRAAVARADARLKEDRRKLDRRHDAALRNTGFRVEIMQSAWLEAMVEQEIAAAF